MGERNIIVDVEKIAGYLAQRDRTIAAQEERIRHLTAGLYGAREVMMPYMYNIQALANWCEGFDVSVMRGEIGDDPRALLAEQPTDGGTGLYRHPAMQPYTELPFKLPDEQPREEA